MKKNLHFILYGLALILVIIPMFAEQTHRMLDPTTGIILTISGLLLLISGKVISMKRRDKEDPARSRDMLLFVILLGLVVWMLVKTFSG